MLKQLKLSYLVPLATIGIIVGCGVTSEEVDRSTPLSDNEGRYIDENVSGLTYESGHFNASGTWVVDLNGTTDARGRFGFIDGQELKLKLAGVEIDSIKPKYLVSGAVISLSQNRPMVASLLQSLDSDGDASNGIIIKPEVIEILKEIGYVSSFDDGHGKLNESILDSSTISSIVTNVQAELNEKYPDVNGSSKVAKLKYIDETRALTHLNATIAKLKPLPSTTVNAVIPMIRDLGQNAQNYSEDEISTKIKAIKTQLDNPLAGDRGLKDIEVAKAMVNLMEITNKDYFTDTFSFKGSTEHMSQMIKEMTFETASGNMDDYTPFDEDTSIVPYKKADAKNILENSKKATLDIASNFKSVSDQLAKALATMPQHYQFAYEDVNLSIDNFHALRASLLASSAGMVYPTAYSKGDDSYYVTKTYDYNGSTYEYYDGGINQDKLLNSGTFGKPTDQTSLTLAKNYLMESAKILKNLDADENLTQESLDYAKNLYSILAQGTGEFTIKEKNATNDAIIKETTLNINNLFKTDTAPSIDDMGTDWAYNCDEHRYYDYSQNKWVEANLSTDTESKIEGGRICKTSNSMYYYDDYYHDADLDPKTLPTVSSSKLDNLIVKIVENGTTYTAQSLLDYLFINDDSNYITESMLNGKVFYETFEDNSYIFYAKSTYLSPTSAERREMAYNKSDGTLVEDITFQVPYTLIDGEIRADVNNNTGYKWFNKEFSNANAWYLFNKDDTNKDGIIDDSGSVIWYLSKPDNFPSAL